MPAVGSSIDRNWRRGEKRGGAINLSPSFTTLQWIAAVAADKNGAFFSSLVIICSAWVDVWSQRSRAREDTAREGRGGHGRSRRERKYGERGHRENKVKRRKKEINVKKEDNGHKWKLLMTAGDYTDGWKKEIKLLITKQFSSVVRWEEF